MQFSHTTIGSLGQRDLHLGRTVAHHRGYRHPIAILAHRDKPRAVGLDRKGHIATLQRKGKRFSL